MQDLYIIGNGFDIFHGIKSSYDDFRKYLLIRNSLLLDNIEKFLGFDMENEKTSVWNKFEYNLRNLEEDYIIEECNCYLVGYGYEEWSDSYHHDYQYCIDTIIRSLTYTLLEEFTLWITTIDNNLDGIERKIEFNPDALFLTFNYTNTLEKVYDIDSNRILHIHNHIGGNQELILGHNYSENERIKDSNILVKLKTISDIDEILVRRALEEEDVRYMEGNNFIKSYYKKNYKDSIFIIQENEDFFKRISSIKNIYLFGHSVSGVDMDYLLEIKNRVNDDVIWHFTWFRDEDKDSIEKFINISKIIFYRLDKMTDYIVL
jgi:hypothetical protein